MEIDTIVEYWCGGEWLIAFNLLRNSQEGPHSKH